MLVNQFVSGLHSELQAKIVGIEGSMDEMVAKARFEETKSKEVTANSPVPFQKKTFTPKGAVGGGGIEQATATKSGTGSD